MENESSILGVALVGLGKYSSGQLAPALQKTRFCRLAGVVSGDEKKRKTWAEKYGLKPENLYSYESFDTIAGNADISIVYVVLPNALHAEYVIRAARAGKHVICEKPMAVTEEDCQRMIDACKKANVRLSVGYRLHFEPYNLSVAAISTRNAVGKVRKITASHGLDIEPGVWRLDRKLAGGGPLMDVGIYCVQAAIYAKGEEPVAVEASFGPTTGDKRFSEVEESISWTMYFADGATAACDSTYSAETDKLRVEADDDWIELQPAYAYNGLKGTMGKGAMRFMEVNQQARQLDHFAECILRNKPTPVPGEMGLRDVRILQAIYRAAHSEMRVGLT